MEVGGDANTGCSCLWHKALSQSIQDSRPVETADPTCQFCMLEELNFALTKDAGQRTEALSEWCGGFWLGLLMLMYDGRTKLCVGERADRPM